MHQHQEPCNNTYKCFTYSDMSYLPQPSPACSPTSCAATPLSSLHTNVSFSLSCHILALCVWWCWSAQSNLSPHTDLVTEMVNRCMTSIFYVILLVFYFFLSLFHSCIALFAFVLHMYQWQGGGQEQEHIWDHHDHCVGDPP